MFNWIEVEVRKQQHGEHVRKFEQDPLVDEMPDAMEPRHRGNWTAMLSLGGRFAAWARCSLERLAFAMRLSSRTPCQ